MLSAGFLGAVMGLLVSGGLVQTLPNRRPYWPRSRLIRERQSPERLAAAEAKRERKGQLRLRNAARSSAGYHPVLQRYPGAAR